MRAPKNAEGKRNLSLRKVDRRRISIAEANAEAVSIVNLLDIPFSIIDIPFWQDFLPDELVEAALISLGMAK